MDTTDTNALLRPLVEQQKQQIALRTEAVERQRRHIELVQHPFAQSEGVNRGAAAIQQRAAGSIRLILWLILPVMLLPIAWAAIRHAV